MNVLVIWDAGWSGGREAFRDMNKWWGYGEIILVGEQVNCRTYQIMLLLLLG